MKCIICQNKVNSYRHPKFNMLFHECESCDFIYKDPIVHPSLEEEKRIYDFHHNDEDNLSYVTYLKDFIHVSVLPFVKNGQILDFGSGPNPVLSKILMNEYHFSVFIYDHIYHPDLSYQKKNYDMIISTEVIEHLKNPLHYFKHFHQLLKPNGYLSLMTLFHPKDQNLLFNWFYIRDITHVSFYTVKTIEKIAELIGFKIIYTNHFRQIVLRKI